MTRIEMETAHFRVEGIAQALYAMSHSETARDVGWALDLLAREADQVSKELEEHANGMRHG